MIPAIQRTIDDQDYEMHCAEELVALLVERHKLPIVVTAVCVEWNWKVKFTFRMNRVVPISKAAQLRGRYDRRPGLEIHWKECVGDVDAWQFAGDAVSLVMHGWQIFKKYATLEEERPSRLLAVAKKQNERQAEA